MKQQQHDINLRRTKKRLVKTKIYNRLEINKNLNLEKVNKKRMCGRLPAAGQKRGFSMCSIWCCL